ncbi:SpaA isopeptide-forming pilin-related protein [Eubacterium coprostanoligenes]|uniref:SpaA isopeptide-forming pilin-related protein n=1 Tax=Eubacterium coprostanoligenes TaxID=290054 RepID=UPI002357AA43|nr:SpaA isopeptide-forming pilin-related protein [Eubacterium coprostanoligenes]MCI6254027.1 Cys-Gln thioester bond-forming surface protein [Eubacterium coprostanoligenes]MDY5399850.1 SpaA isopeptide-forming pilin-related protein [Eubacterium coprostanoligenes]
MKNKFKQLVAMLLSLLIIISTFPATVYASTFITDMNSDAEFGVVSGSYDKYGHEMHYAKYDGKTYIVFCVEYGKTSPTGTTYEYGKDFVKYVNRSGETYRKIADYIAFGYTLQYGDGLPSTKAEWIAACCTQQFVWETLGVNPTRSSWDSTYMSDSLYKSWLADTEDLIDLYYNKQVSFNGSTKTINLGGSATLTDSNGVLKYYPTFSKTVDKVTISHTNGENKLTVSVAENCTTHSVSFNSAAYSIYKNLPNGNSYDDDTTNYVYFEFDKGAIQNLMFSKQADPQTFKFNIDVEFGNIKITKTSEDNIVKGMVFTVKGNGKTYTMTTDANGTAELNNIPVGTYTISENDIVRYVKQTDKTVTVSDGKTANVSFDNVLKKFRITVTKSDIEKGHAQGDASLAGAVYGIYKGEQLIDTYTTDENASFTTKYYVCDDDWTIKEIKASEGYNLDTTIYKIGAEPKNYTVEYNDCSNTVKEQVIKGNIAIIKHTDDGSTQIETPEKGAEFQIYLKSAGSFVNADKDERDTIVCDEDGFASSKLLPYGVYTVHQTKGWDGREKIKDFDVFINSDGKTYKFLINNANFESYLKVVKLDAETNKPIAYEGAAFEIYDSDNHRISMQFTYPQVTTIHTFYTNSEGYLITPEKLPYGDYTLVEVQAPYGYVLDSTPIPFTITQENSSTDTGVTVVKVKARDMAQKGVIEITKTGEVFASVNENEGVYTPVYETQNLANAVFQIYAAEDITTLDGTVRVQQGELVDEITTGANGVAKSKELYLGKYTVIEKTAPNGYVNANEQYNVELTYAGQNVSVTSTALTVNNDRQKVTVSLKKALKKDKLFNIGDNDEILSVQFGIVANEYITAADGSIIPKDALITFANCDIDGKITFDCDLPIGYEFYAKEIATDEQYILSDTKYEFETAYAGQETEVIAININDGKPIDNSIKRGKVSGVKKDENGNALGGALICLFKADTTEYTKENALMTATSADDGSFYFDNVPYGNWCVREIAPPTAFVLNEQIFDVNIAENEQVVEIEIVNEFIRGNIALTKVDKDYPDNRLTGAEFEVFEDTNGNGKYDNEDKSVGKLTEIETGIYAMNDLVYGQYFVREIKAPENFLLDENVYSLFIDTDGKTYIVENEAGVGFINAAMTGSLKIVKTSSDGKIEGFSFRVTGANGYDETFKTDKNGEILIENLRIGEYHITEVSDKVSAGYILADDKDATVKADATTIVKMHNEKKKTPKTSDNINKRALATAMSVSALGAVSLAYYLLKKKKNNKEEK